MSKILTFGELKAGDKFIAFPVDGDDSGHGGYRGGHNVFEKIEIKFYERSDYYTYEDICCGRRLNDGNESEFPDSMKVLRVLL